MSDFHLATGERLVPVPPPATNRPSMLIRVRHRPETLRIRIERLLFPPAVPAGMNPYVLMGLVRDMRGTNEDPPPIEVAVEGDLYRIKDGRHRTVAAMMAGRPDVLAKIVEES